MRTDGSGLEGPGTRWPMSSDFPREELIPRRLLASMRIPFEPRPHSTVSDNGQLLSGLVF